MTLSVAVIGAGRIAQTAHLPALAKTDTAELVAVCDASEHLATTVARRYDTPAYTDVDSLLAREAVDAVIVAVPDRLHLPLAARALSAGKHVLVEKPLADSVDAAEQLAEIAEQSGCVLQVGAMKRHDAGVQYAATVIRERLGAITSATIWYRVMSKLRHQVEATMFPPLVEDTAVRLRETAFKANRAEYLLRTHGAHVFDGLRYLLGDVADVSAQRRGSSSDLSWHGLVNCTTGALASFEITANVHGEWSEGTDVYGEYGTVKLRTHFPFRLLPSDVEWHDESTQTTTRPIFGDGNPYRRQIEAFAAAVAGRSNPTPDARDGIAAARLIDATAASAARSGALVALS